MKVEKESGESQRIRSQLAGLCRRGGLVFLSKSSKPVGASTIDSSSEDSDSEEKNKPKPKSKANSKEKATPKTAAKPKVPQKRKELIEKKSSEGRRRWKTEAAQPTAEPPKQMEAAKASEPSANPGRNPVDKAERSKGSKQVEKLGAKPAEKRAANSEKNEEEKTENLTAEKPKSIQTEMPEKDSAEKPKKDSAVHPDDYSASMHATHSSVPNTPPLLAHASTPSALFPSESLSLRSPPLPPVPIFQPTPPSIRSPSRRPAVPQTAGRKKTRLSLLPRPPLFTSLSSPSSTTRPPPTSTALPPSYSARSNRNSRRLACLAEPPIPPLHRPPLD